tara:strand:- start:2 stop:604 length:603 start_codon:yes stop_codon:yes gene_type:complete
MADNTPFKDINITAGDTERSARWYAQQVSSYARHLRSPSELYNSDLGEMADQLEVGSMYMFEYEPKTKDLEYFDRFPLTIIVDPLPDGFSGINLHYLRPMLRAALLDKLMPAFADIRRESKLASNWATVRNFAKFPEVKGSTKKYLSSQMGPMFKVYPAHWKSAIFLPVQQFAGGVGLQKIYRETMAKPMRKRKGGIGGF